MPQPRQHIWMVVGEVTEAGQITISQAMSLVEEYVYCQKGVEIEAEIPNSQLTNQLLSKMANIAYDFFRDYHY